MKNKIILRVFLFLALGIVLQFIGGKILKGDLYSFARIMFHDMHTKENIDTIFIGDSHVYRGINPKILSDGLNQDVFVAATGSQKIDGAYAIVREALYCHPEIKTIYVDLDFIHNDKAPFKERNHLPHIYAISDNLTNKKVKWDFLLHSTSPKYWINHCLTFAKNHVSPRPHDVINTVKSYFTGDYWRYNYPVYDTEKYVGDGFIPYTVSFPEDFVYYIGKPDDFSQEEVSSDWLKSFNQIVDYCIEHNVELNIMAMPESDFCIRSHKKYDEYIDYIKNNLAGKNVAYYDFNLVKKEYLNFEITNFEDTDHLNIYGAEKFSNFLVDFISSNRNTNMYFHPNVADKQISLNNCFLGITDYSSTKSMKLEPIFCLDSNSKITFDYILYENGKPAITLFENTEATTLNFPQKSKGYIKILVYLNGEQVATTSKSFNTLWIR